MKAMKKRHFYLEFQLSVAVINTMSDRIHRRGMGFSDLQVVGPPERKPRQEPGWQNWGRG